MTKTHASPIFVVGASRSGTSMLREILNRHPAVWIVRETHYFEDLRPRLPSACSGTRGSHEERSRCESYFGALERGAYGQADARSPELEDVELRREAERLGGSPDAYFEAFCALRARAAGKARWGEKTPRHVFRIADIVTAFPSAQVVCLARDPRAVVASYRDWKRDPATDESPTAARDRRRIEKSYNVVLQGLLWRSAMQAALDAVRRHGPQRIRLQPYEDLVSAPEASLGELCNWLGLDFRREMLDVPVVHSSYAGSAPELGITTAPLERWRVELTAPEVAVIESCCADLMESLGYVPARPPVSTVQVARAWLTVPGAFVRAALVNRRRIGQMRNYVRTRARLVLRRPQAD